MDKDSQIGDFSIFGFTEEPIGALERRISDRLGVTPRIFTFGNFGSLFFYTTYGEVAESEDKLVLKLGFLRSPEMSSLSAQQLIEGNIINPTVIENERLRGNALVACLGKNDCSFAAFKTLLGVPQLYYSISDHEIICSDRLKCVVTLLDHVELNEDVVPMHFLFRSIPGDLTYYRRIKRMLPGHFLKWADGNAEIGLMRSLDAVADETQYIRNEGQALNLVYESLNAVVADYTAQIERAGQKQVNLLSGGVDSTLLQLLINANSSRRPSQSISFSIQGLDFKFEVEYARQASQLLHTEHTFVEYAPDDFPGLLTRAIDILAQPPALDTEPSMLAIAEFVRAENRPERYFFSGQAADGLFGLPGARKLKGLYYISKLPFAISLLKGMATIMTPVPTLSKMLLKGAEILTSEDHPDAYASPSNTISVYVEEWDIARHCFGDKALQKALAYRRNLVAQYSRSHHYLDMVYFIDLLTDAYEVSVQRQQLFLANYREQVHPFLDDNVLIAALTIHPDLRYIKGLRPKHLLKRLLQQKTNSPATHLRKGLTTIEKDLVAWMQSGPLRPMVENIQLPGFLSKADFERMIQKPSYFLWSLLTYDIFNNRVLKNQEHISFLERG